MQWSYVSSTICRQNIEQNYIDEQKKLKKAMTMNPINSTVNKEDSVKLKRTKKTHES